MRTTEICGFCRAVKFQPSTIHKTMKKSFSGRIIRSAGCVLALMGAQMAANAQTSVQRPVHAVETGSNTWYYLVMEGESFIDASKQAAPGTGFVKVWNDEAL